MQELLGRLGSLDPESSQGLRVIACFDELMTGGVGVRGLVAAAAALSGVVAGAEVNGQPLRVNPQGEDVPGPPSSHCSQGGTTAPVWIERDPLSPHANDSIVLERLGLAVALRLSPGEHHESIRRDLAVALDPELSAERRAEAAVRMRLLPNGHYRVLAAPLFATWDQHPRGPEDVVTTSHGPVHFSIVREGSHPLGAPLGLGVTVGLDDLPRSAATALIALRLYEPGAEKTSRQPVDADALGGLADLLAQLPEAGTGDLDVRRIADISQHPWGRDSVLALVESSSIREAARAAGVHHSTMAARAETITATLGFDPLVGIGRTRLGVAYLRWRLSSSQVLTLPSPG